MLARWPLLLTHLSLILSSPAALAQIVTDGTVGPATRLSGPEMIVGAELGATRGANLFHSFQRFDIPTGQRATFTGPDQIRNVIGRVTGGQTSQIDGTLRSTVGQADVYLINPAGVVMGPNAKVDVPAALHLSTADELRFSDGSRYSASDPANSTLTLAAPESFGFLSPQPAPLNIEGSQLELKPGQTATLTAGDVSITGTAERRATLSVPGGEIRIEAVGDQGGQVSVIMPTEQPGRGRLSIEQARIETSGDGGGRLSVRAGEASLTQATLATDNRGQQDAANGIDMRVAGDLRLWAGILQSKAVAGGRSGDVTITAGALTMFDGAYVETTSYGAGQIGLEAGRLYLQQGGQITTNDTFLGGDGGNIRVSVNDLLIDGGQITSRVGPRSSGRGGEIHVKAADSLVVMNTDLSSNG
jgi:filamentous hemagglutinin family protein